MEYDGDKKGGEGQTTPNERKDMPSTTDPDDNKNTDTSTDTKRKKEESPNTGAAMEAEIDDIYGGEAKDED